MRVTVLGASGFVGRHLSAALEARGFTVTRASARDVDAAARACEGADAVVNLAGASISKRWTPAHKAEMRSSRVDLTRRLIDRFAGLVAPPLAYVSASAVGYYGMSDDATFTEESPPGRDFLAELCVAWEREAFRAREFGARVAIIRSGLVLGPDGGLLAFLLTPFRLGLGGRIGNGKQWMSWIHIDDAVGVYIHALERGDGVYNATAPNPVTNERFTQTLARTVRRPAILPVPPLALQALLGEGASIAVRGQRVLPQRTRESGYIFRYETIDAALAAIV